MTGMASRALLWGLFIPLLDGNTVFPEATVVHVRMLFLKPGMVMTEAMRVLLLSVHNLPRAPLGSIEFGPSSAHHAEVSYKLEPNYWLTLQSTLHPKPRLSEVALYRVSGRERQ